MDKVVAEKTYYVSWFAYRWLEIYGQPTDNVYFKGTEEECKEYVKTHYGVMVCPYDGYVKRNKIPLKKGDLFIQQNSNWLDNGWLKCLFIGTKDECEKFIEHSNKE